MHKYKILCVISARGGSKGIKNKNIIDFCGKPLIAWSILQAQKSKIIDNVYISTDSKKIAKISRKYGAKILFLRNKKLAQKNTSKFLVWKDALNKIEKINKKKYDFFFDLDCTNPLRNLKDIDGILRFTFSKIEKFDSVITIAKSRKNPYFNMLEKNNKRFLKISKNIKNLPTSRQTSPEVYDQVASMYLIKSNFLRNKSKLYDGRVGGYLLKDYQNFDIDSHLDYKIISYLFKKYYLRHS
tara:strand:+ start:3634 stop:4356 length:723 start_codon:yes stop_codon:yes gene_type:complete